MIIYKVEVETYDSESGRHIGWATIGYYFKKKTAIRIAKETIENGYWPSDEEAEAFVRTIDVDMGD